MSEESLQFVGSAALLFFCILIVHSLWMTARKIPAARNVRPNGVKGGLLLTVIFCFAMVVIDAASAANILIFVNGQSPAAPRPPTSCATALRALPAASFLWPPFTALSRGAPGARFGSG